MSSWTIIKVALRALARNKLRSSLTALGLIIGVGAVVALVGIGNGAKAQIEAKVASMGLNVLQVKAGSQSKNAGATIINTEPMISNERRQPLGAYCTYRPSAIFINAFNRR